MGTGPNRRAPWPDSESSWAWAVVDTLVGLVGRPPEPWALASRPDSKPKLRADRGSLGPGPWGGGRAAGTCLSCWFQTFRFGQTTRGRRCTSPRDLMSCRSSRVCICSIPSLISSHLPSSSHSLPHSPEAIQHIQVVVEMSFVGRVQLAAAPHLLQKPERFCGSVGFTYHYLQLRHSSIVAHVPIMYR